MTRKRGIADREKMGMWSFYDRLMKGIFKATVRKDDCYMDMTDKTEVVVKSITEPRWHLYFLAVDPKYQSQGLGSGAIQGLNL